MIYDVVTKFNKETNAPEIVSVWGTFHDDFDGLLVALKEDGYKFMSTNRAFTVATDGTVRTHDFIECDEQEAEKAAAMVRKMFNL